MFNQKKKCQFNTSLDDGAYNCDIFFFTIWLEGCVYVIKYVTVFYLLQDFLYGIFYFIKLQMVACNNFKYF